MKSVVEGECGRANGLVSLANNYGQSDSRVPQQFSRGLNRLLPSRAGDQLANEFLAEKAAQATAPTSFDMQSLSRQLPPTAHHLSNRWINEFDPKSSSAASSSSSFSPVTSSSHLLASQWANEFQPATAALHNQWVQQFNAPQSSMEAAWSMAYQPQSNKSSDPSMWSAEFLDTVDASIQQNDNISKIADDWAKEFNYNHEEELWSKLEKEWAKQKEEYDGAQVEGLPEADMYIHQSENPFLNQQNAMDIGDAAMNGGNLDRAILAYEAAVQNNPQDASAWCKLGLSHAENEHDEKAIQAFRKALELAPDNKEALISIAVSLANECLENDALESLEKWLVAHNGGDPRTVKRIKPSYSSFLDQTDFQRVESLFLSASARQSEADADLQNALGVLYNIGRNFDRAVDSLRVALSMKPEDARLWNRLGATLANGERTADAIAAYREALRLFPGYVRARYNLGISCMHLGSYREAVQHFLSALEVQTGPRDASTIWSPLRSSAIRIPEHQAGLLDAIDRRDIPAIKGILSTFESSHFVS